LKRADYTDKIGKRKRGVGSKKSLFAAARFQRAGFWSYADFITKRFDCPYLRGSIGWERKAMTDLTDDLSRKHCTSCEGGIPALAPAQIQILLAKVPQWSLTLDGQRIRREWRVKNFVTALEFFRRVGEIAEARDITRICISWATAISPSKSGHMQLAD
jgi:hypothetical protein